MGLNQIILDLRNDYGVSQKQVAEATGISQSTIAKIEIGRNEATASTIRKLAEYFHVSTDYLLEQSDTYEGEGAHTAPSALPAKEEEILRHFRKLSPALQDAAIETVRVLAGVPSEGGLQKKA
ncbi:MAG: helix-turn-helix domain-containing protein [Clostridia bacterium]|nr:helix-turn-helix domain-containing protein [Clostridia bacterium]